jgi:hypothetical protein
VLGGLAIDRLITAAVVGRSMDLVRTSQHPMDMGELARAKYQRGFNVSRKTP